MTQPRAFLPEDVRLAAQTAIVEQVKKFDAELLAKNPDRKKMQGQTVLAGHLGVSQAAVSKAVKGSVGPFVLRALLGFLHDQGDLRSASEGELLTRYGASAVRTVTLLDRSTPRVVDEAVALFKKQHPANDYVDRAIASCGTAFARWSGTAEAALERLNRAYDEIRKGERPQPPAREGAGGDTDDADFGKPRKLAKKK